LVIGGLKYLNFDLLKLILLWQTPSSVKMWTGVAAQI
jgi:hypothetical protein